MRRITLALSLTLCMAQAPAVQVVENVMILNVDDVEACDEGGGCKVITDKKLKALQKQAAACGAVA